MDDFERPLTKRGRRSASQVGHWMVEHGYRPRLVLCSSARRTRETLELLETALGARVPLHIEPGLYLADAATLLARVRRVAADVACVLVIAHNPGLQELAWELASLPGAATAEMRARLTQKFPTAALARFRLKIETWQQLSAGAAENSVKLLNLVTPSEIETET